MEASLSLGQDVIGWRQPKTSGETLREKVLVRQFAQANNGIVAHDNPVSDTTTENDSEMNNEEGARKLPRLAEIRDLLQIWQGNQNLRATQMESRAQNKQMTAVGYISGTEEIVKALQSLLNLKVRLRSNCQKDLLCTTIVCNGPPWRTNSSIQCPLNPKNQPSSS